jgi:hypothetical protein
VFMSPRPSSSEGSNTQLIVNCRRAYSYGVSATIASVRGFISISVHPGQALAEHFPRPSYLKIFFRPHGVGTVLLHLRRWSRSEDSCRPVSIPGMHQ